MILKKEIRIEETKNRNLEGSLRNENTNNGKNEDFSERSQTAPVVAKLYHDSKKDMKHGKNMESSSSVLKGFKFPRLLFLCSPSLGCECLSLWAQLNSTAPGRWNC